MPRTELLARAALIVALAAGAASARAQNAVTIDATEQPAPPDTGFLRFGSTRSPTGHVIAANSRYMTRDGKPWLPVMGEFHFSRYPARYWDEELEKMKAGGVEIVATYVFWNHHEEIEGQFDWSGQRDLRAFVQAAARHGLLVWARVGPWSHGESRNGGFPDWLVKKVGPGLRSDDSTYLAYVARFYDQIGAELHGLLWKDGGPVIGVQLENEYTARGAGRGPEHILRLKALARAAGLDVPMYSVTGWDGASFPPAEVIPVFGGYPDAPWDAAITTLPPNEVYAFRFDNRVAGNMGTQGWNGQLSETAASALAPYPFFGAEYAGGIEVTYHRRPIIAPDDIAAMLPVQLGSGVNLYGYYMFQGGANPPGKLTTLQESQLTGYPTDVNVESYDFQAPLSEFGEEREVFRRIKPVHQFLHAFGPALAPMVVRRPSVVPRGPADTSVVRVSARTLGDSGFVFVGNYVRNYHMPARPGFQVTLRLPDETLAIPSAPVTVPSGAYFIWPVNLGIGGARLKYATAQLVTRLDGAVPTWVFEDVFRMRTELAFDAATVASIDAPGATVTHEPGRVVVHLRSRDPGGSGGGTGTLLTVRARDGSRARILVLTHKEAGDAWVVRLGGAERLLLTSADVFTGADGVHLRQRGKARFTVDVYPAPREAPRASVPFTRDGSDGVFARYVADLPVRHVPLTYTKVRDAQAVPPVRRVNTVSWRKDSVALAPGDSDFARAAVWRIVLPTAVLAESAPGHTSDVFLQIRYVGDVGRLYAGAQLLDDDFYKGLPWNVGLKRFVNAGSLPPLDLRILPLRGDAPVYLQPGRTPSIARDAQRVDLLSVLAVPEYEVILPTRP